VIQLFCTKKNQSTNTEKKQYTDNLEEEQKSTLLDISLLLFFVGYNGG